MDQREDGGQYTLCIRTFDLPFFWAIPYIFLRIISNKASNSHSRTMPILSYTAVLLLMPQLVLPQHHHHHRRRRPINGVRYSRKVSQHIMPNHMHISSSTLNPERLISLAVSSAIDYVPSRKSAISRAFGDLWKLRIDLPGGHFEGVNIKDEERTAQLGSLETFCFPENPFDAPQPFQDRAESVRFSVPQID